MSLTTLLLLLSSARAQDDAGPPATLRCCDHPAVEAAVLAVVDVAHALATEPDRATAALRRVRDRVEVPAGLPAPDRAALEDLRRAARSWSLKPDGAADGLPFLSRQALWLALRHEGGAIELAEGWCPDRDAGWLQRDLEVPRSPWGGCGGWR